MILNQNLKLFHGSKNGLNDKIQPISRTLCDFGKGFYMGTEPEQPLTLICNYENATIYELELNTNNLNIKEIPLNLDWVLFVAFNRGRLSKDIALVESLSALKLGVQYVAITQKACNSIQIINEHKLTKEEKYQLIITSEENRKVGISLVDEICRKYRREGKYFDEIINQ